MKKIKCDFAKEKNGNSKLTAEQIEEIRQTYKTEGLTQRELADKFGICKTHARRIIRYESWA
jgi:DNA-binding transcriptional regulator LsrR (DeoR family)